MVRADLFDIVSQSRRAAPTGQRGDLLQERQTQADRGGSLCHCRIGEQQCRAGVGEDIFDLGLGQAPADRYHYRAETGRGVEQHKIGRVVLAEIGDMVSFADTVGVQGSRRPHHHVGKCGIIQALAFEFQGGPVGSGFGLAIKPLTVGMVAADGAESGWAGAYVMTMFLQTAQQPELGPGGGGDLSSSARSLPTAASVPASIW